MRGQSRIVPVMAMVVMVFSAVACASPSDSELGAVVKKVGGAYDGAAAAASPYSRPMNVGEVVVTTDKADVTLHALSRDSQGWAAPEAGQQFLVLDLTLVNRSGADLNFQPQEQLQLTDQTNSQYRALAVKGFDPLVAGTRVLATGVPVRGQVAFAVPAQAQGLALTWAPIAPTILVIQGLAPSGAAVPAKPTMPPPG